MTATPNRQMVFRVTKRSPFNFTESGEMISFRNNNWQQAKISVQRLGKAGYTANVASIDKEMVEINLKAVDINDLRIAMAKSGQEFAKTVLKNLDKLSDGEKIKLRELIKIYKAY